MNKKKISAKVLKKILEKMPLSVRKKIIDAHKEGKKIKLNITKKKNENLNSPYQDK